MKKRFVDIYEAREFHRSRTRLTARRTTTMNAKGKPRRATALHGAGPGARRLPIGSRGFSIRASRPAISAGTCDLP